MKHHFLFLLAVALVLLVWAAGCRRQNSSVAGGEQDKQFEPGAVGLDSEQYGYLGLKILKVHENQRMLDQAPWYSDGGDWTFLECQAEKDPAAKLVIGVKVRKAAPGDSPFGWGDAVIAVSNAEAGGKFVEAFARAFHQAPPEPQGNQPTLRVNVHTAVMGVGLVRDLRGGFKNGNGNWVATKWFLQDDMAETEVFFNYDALDGKAEFTEKDEEYREDLVRQLAVGLRDGPLPERTLANDPSLTKSGPTISGWTKVCSSNETCRFASDSQSIIITATKADRSSQLFSAPVAEPDKRTLLGEFSGSIYVQQQISTAQGTAFLVLEQVHANSKTISSDDPQRLWLLNSTGKRGVSAPDGVPKWFVSKAGLSPNGRYIGLGSWVNEPDKKRSRVIHLGDLKTGAWRQIHIPGTILELVGWAGENRKPVALTGLGIKKDEARKAYSVDLDTGGFTALDSVPDEFISGNLRSPDKKHIAEVIGKERIKITDVKTGEHREFVFHPYDRHTVYPESVRWADDRYLAFQGVRTSLINIESLKMNYPTTKESGFDSVEFSPDFKLAIGLKSDGQYLGRVTLVEDQGK